MPKIFDIAAFDTESIARSAFREQLISEGEDPDDGIDEVDDLKNWVEYFLPNILDAVEARMNVHWVHQTISGMERFTDFETHTYGDGPSVCHHDCSPVPIYRILSAKSELKESEVKKQIPDGVVESAQSVRVVQTRENPEWATEQTNKCPGHTVTAEEVTRELDDCLFYTGVIRRPLPDMKTSEEDQAKSRAVVRAVEMVLEKFFPEHLPPKPRTLRSRIEQFVGVWDGPLAAEDMLRRPTLEALREALALPDAESTEPTSEDWRRATGWGSNEDTWASYERRAHELAAERSKS